MDRTMPAGAAMLLDFIGDIEAPKGYGTIYANKQHKLAKPLTSMTLGDVVDAQKAWSKNHGSSAAPAPFLSTDRWLPRGLVVILVPFPRIRPTAVVFAYLTEDGRTLVADSLRVPSKTQPTWLTAHFAGRQRP